MHLTRGLPISFIEMLLIVSTASKPMCQNHLKESAKSKTLNWLSSQTQHLLEEYVNSSFQGEDPQLNLTITDIILPVTSVSTVRSSCAINGYLEQLKQMIQQDDLTGDSERFMYQTEVIRSQFIAAMDNQNCEKLDLEKPGDSSYKRKLMGYKILDNVSKWLKGYVGY